jgi:lipid A 3-O-deacylase
MGLIRLFIIGWLCAATAMAQDVGGAYAFTLENDVFTGSDDSYSNGAALSWVSGPTDAYGEDTVVRRWSALWSFLPGVANPNSTNENGVNYVSWTVLQEIHTPSDIARVTPDPRDQPYSGYLLADFNIYSLYDNWGQVWNLRLGLVGPSARAAQTQRAVHKVIDSVIPQGWDSQIKDEPVLNIGYTAGYKLIERQLSEQASWRITPLATAEAGTYSTTVAGGFVAELGWNLPSSLGICSMANGIHAACAVGVTKQQQWSVTSYFASGYYRVWHYLPLDGPVFRDGPSVGRHIDPLATFNTLGVSLHKGAFSMAFAVSYGATAADRIDEELDYGTLTLVYQY